MRQAKLVLVCLTVMATAIGPGRDASAQTTLWDRARHPELRDIEQDVARGRSLLEAARRLEYQLPHVPTAARERYVLEANAILANAAERAPERVGALLGYAEALEALQALDDARVVDGINHYAEALLLL